MIKIEHLQVFNFEGAIRGLRNPMSSWNKSDSDVAFHMVENFASDDPMAEKYRVFLLKCSQKITRSDM